MLPANTWLDNRYHIIRQLGGGGMGTVYLAEDSRFGAQLCAITLNCSVPEDTKLQN